LTIDNIESNGKDQWKILTIDNIENNCQDLHIIS